MVLVLIFTSIDFLPSLTRTSLSHMHCLCQAFTAPTHTPSQTERSTPTHHDCDLAGHRNCADRRQSRSRSRRSASIAIIEIGEIAIAISLISREASIAIAISRSRSARLRSRSRRSRSLRSRSRSRSHRENMLSFWVLFEFLGMNDIM